MLPHEIDGLLAVRSASCWGGGGSGEFHWVARGTRGGVVDRAIDRPGLMRRAPVESVDAPPCNGQPRHAEGGRASKEREPTKTARRTTRGGTTRRRSRTCWP